MFLKKQIAAGLVALGTAVTAMPANAVETQVASTPSLHIEIGGHGWDHGGWSHHRLSGREIRRILRRQGWHDIEIVDRGRRTYTVRAENYRGRDYILRVSARSGEVISARRIRRGGGYGGGHGHGG